MKQFGNHRTCLRSALDSVQSVHTSKSKHDSAGRKSFHNEVSQPHAILYKDSGAPSGGSNLFQQREGKAAPSLANLRAGENQSSPHSPLIPQLTKHCAVSVSDMLCLSGHLDMHLVSQGVRLSIAAPDGRALITASHVSKPARRES